MSELVAIGILGAVGLVFGINQLQNKSNPSEAITSPSRRNSPRPSRSPSRRNSPRPSRRNSPRPSRRNSPRPSRRNSPRPSRRNSARPSRRNSARPSRRNSARPSRRPSIVKPTSMRWDPDITKTYQATVGRNKIKSQTVFMELLVKANYTKNFTEFDEYFDFVLKQPKAIVIQLFNHRHKDIPNATGSCLSALFIFKNYKYLLKIVNHYGKDILDILVSDGLEKSIPDECLLNLGQLLYLFKIYTELPDKYKKIKLYSLFFLIKDFESEFNKLFTPYSKYNPHTPFPTVEDYITFEDYKDWGIIRNFDIEIDNPQKSLNEFKIQSSDIIQNYLFPRIGNPIWVQDVKKNVPHIKIDLQNIKHKFSRNYLHNKS